MKPLAAYILFLGTAMTAFLSSETEERPSYYAQLDPIALESPVKLSESIALPIEPIALKEEPSSKSYNIFFENKSTAPLKVAIRYKSLDGEWHTDGLTTLPPGERKLMGKSEYRTYFYHIAKKDEFKNMASASDFKFPLKAQSRKKVVFKKKEIWECYDKQTCNAFAVFR